MTKEKLLLMDVEISEKIFGVKYYLSDYVYINGRRVDIPTWILEGWSPVIPPGGWSAGVIPPHYTTDISLAMEVVEALKNMWRKREYQSEYDRWELKDIGHLGWIVSIKTALSGKTLVSYVGKSLPLAICHCALEYLKSK